MIKRVGENTYLRTMVEQTRPRNLLLVTTTQSVSPIPRNTPSPFSFYDMVHLNDCENLQEIDVCHTP